MTTLAVTDWKKEWFEIEDATYLNTAAHTVMPRVSIRAVEHALEAKTLPHRVGESVWFEAPVRIRMKHTGRTLCIFRQRLQAPVKRSEEA